MGHVYNKQVVEGITIPAIIHNGNYFLIQMAVYENGTVSCWHKSDLQQFRDDLKNGWVVTKIPINSQISIHSLGTFPICDAKWSFNSETYYSYVENVVRSLNPEMTNLYQITPRETKKWKSAHVFQAASPTPYKLKSAYGYNMLDGESNYIFYRKDNQIFLTPITVYADKTIRIDAEDEHFYSLKEIEELIAANILCTCPKGDELVKIENFGELLLAPPSYSRLSNDDKLAELTDEAVRLSGEKDSLDRCMDAHYQYLIDPNDNTREMLRKAYEAVPPHQRMFLGDMDTKDHDIIRILNYPNSKREV